MKNPCGVAKTNNSCPPSCASPAALKGSEENLDRRDACDFRLV